MSSAEPSPAEAPSPAGRLGFSTAQTSDSLDAAGLREQVVRAPIRPLRPGFRAAGRARTVRFGPAESAGDDPYDDMIDFIDGIRPGELVVVAADGSDRSALWGELFTAAARGHGAAGVVCDGFTRDHDRVLALDLPVFSRGALPVDYRARQRVVAVQEPVTCGGVRIVPGDLVVADDDGVVRVPADREAEVTGLASRRAGTEDRVLSALLDGDSLRDVWERFRVL
ncbi:RraA family protein [Actinomadura rupiterrae]|uniref:RraA family protein n=1 Tax=Actinomadura rupiterrae TaxID=559627 RepID=UPI0020A49BB0|nr:RraA family protein [Actinomadura rupiterrae]MCP2339105.1 regulator of RNase E activity RraA [Actinomadura rupiterrae]